MPTASIQLADQRTAYSPKETITGKVSWQCDQPPQSAELRLTWRAQGRGQSDSDTVETIPFSDPQSVETRPFAFTLPNAPYSFSGSLIQLTWALELELQPGDVTESVNIILAPNGKTVSLPRVAGTSVL